MVGAAHRLRGFTLVELLVALALAALLLTAVSGLVRNVKVSDALATERNRLQREARFALERMGSATANAGILVLPLPDKPDTDWRENVREQTIPASPPEGSSTAASAVLAVSLGVSVDLDADGFPDADNDRDGRIDEDWPSDATYDAAPGVYLIDDSGSGGVDDSAEIGDEDERFDAADEDPVNGIDDEGDGVIDEDSGADMNGDGAPGISGVDDDGDGNIDEGNPADDDEDGRTDEDWLDVVAFYLDGDALVERHAVPWDEDGVGGVSGRDFVESVIASNVTRFRVERLLPGAGGAQLVDLTLELAGPGGTEVSVSLRIRLGGAR